MIKNCFKISEELQLQPMDYESAVKELQTSDANIWIDLQDFETSELEKELDTIEIKDLARRLCLEARDRPGFYPVKDLTFMVIPVHKIIENFAELEYVALLMRKNLLLILRDKGDVRLQRLSSLKESATWLPDNSIAGLVSAIMIALSLDSLQSTAELRKKILTLEKRMNQGAHLIKMKDISDLQSELLILESVVSGQLPIIESIIKTDRISLIFKNALDYLNCALVNLQSTNSSLNWLQGRLDLMRSLMDMNTQEITNRRLGRLTILSMIFMPITLLAGIWGMNFDIMPELHLTFGYPLALGSMVLIGVALYNYFKKLGWFD